MMNIIGMCSKVIGWVRHPVDAWHSFVDLVGPPPAWMKGPYKTSITHAVVTVLGLMAPLPKLGPVPLGPFGIALFFLTGIPFVWLAASGLTLGWYWRREYLQTGLKPKPKYRKGEKLSFGERYDTWMDVLAPTAAFVLQWMWLL